ncbi:peptidyl-prolyl cis-trans isomerase FKBP13, chloroplastic-like [Macadamia integrifolia]|uniref:peptidyl-prolyl cis-trans isomerase FKBP13, chloroplastic-like n=1 Tax=Macadamia integrifolia TaxID=60698 RepID=UPI001C52846A|nr:peptidyl-prolyl cis-trans isomerase FKBP13, chloroplastic-like [Macadamia integrifolia]
MSASALALGSFSSLKLNKTIKTAEATTTTISVNQNNHKRLPPPPPPPPPQLPLQEKERSVVLGRREAIGFGFCLGIIEGFVQKSEAAEAQCELTTTPSGLAYCDQVIGTGPEASKGQLIKAHYLGKLDNGKVFDSSYNRGKPLTFRIGVGEVIKGWDQGILGGDGIPPMLAGGKRTLKIPPELGYGMRGAGCRGGSCIIPPDSVLLFDVEFIGKT